GTVEQLFWVSGLNDPKGMALYNGVLYVADINQVVAIASQTGSVIARYEAEGAQGLNDITVDESGNLYISDKEGKKIYQLRNGRLSLWLDNTQGQEPNGLVAENNQLLTNFSTNGTVKKIDLNNKTVTDWLNGIPSADGLVSDGRGNYFISNWNGEIYYATGLGNIWLVLGTKDQKINSADIGMSTRDQTLFVPTFFDNRVVAYRIMQQNN
ncbi:MAG: gluconolaconase, partial [Hymenobacteraceae bacterium]|nr:gluconolaconase [Hymenobacteraceae bacterium]MDX5394748.1 gluconolaconase [Hymenobacteraceae bacterium]MDX5510781.1 gluconolaconase [Hymenobacteraceae bacterium]